MTNKLVVTVIADGTELGVSAPGGFRYVQEVFGENRLKNKVDDALPGTFWQRMRVLQRALNRAFEAQVAISILSPWTFSGFWFIIRHRIRGFPCIVIDGQRYDFDAPQDVILDAVRRSLSGRPSA